MRRKKKSARFKPRKKLTQPTYLDPETWRRTAAQRDQILKQFLFGLAEGKLDIANELVRRFGAYQVNYVLEKFQEYSRPSFLVDEATIYRHYRWLFAQFGGGRAFLTKQGYDAVIDEETRDAEWINRNVFGLSDPDEVFESERLVHLSYAIDITPPAVPPKPTDFSAPAHTHTVTR